MVKSYSCMYRNGHCTVWNEQMVLQNHIQWSYCYRIGKLLLKRSQLSSQPDIGVTKHVKISRADWSTCWFNNRLISHIRRALTRQGTIELAREHLPISPELKTKFPFVFQITKDYSDLFVTIAPDFLRLGPIIGYDITDLGYEIL